MLPVLEQRTGNDDESEKPFITTQYFVYPSLDQERSIPETFKARWISGIRFWRSMNYNRAFGINNGYEKLTKSFVRVSPFKKSLLQTMRRGPIYGRD